MFGTTPIGGPGDGLFPPTIQHLKVKLTSATARATGLIVALDMANATTGLSTSPGGIAGTSIYNTARDVAAGASAEGYPVCILEEDFASGTTGKVTFMGPVTAKVTGVVAAGVLLTVDTTNFTLKAASAATDRIVGINLAAVSTAITPVYFNGLVNLGAPVA